MPFLVTLTRLAVFVATTAPLATYGQSKPLPVAFGNGPVPFDAIADLASAKKDQFETTAAFDKRRCDALTPLLGAEATKPMVIRSIEGTRSWYDADRQRFFFENVSKAGFPSNGFYLVLSAHETERQGYVGKTAYGATKEVTVKEGYYIALSIPHSSHLVKHLGVELPMKPDQARAIAGDLRLEVVTRLGPTCLSSELHRESPTLDAPVKETSRVYALRAQPEATSWRVVRASTGEILKSGKP